MNIAKTFVIESISDSSKAEILLYGDSLCNANQITILCCQPQTYLYIHQYWKNKSRRTYFG